MFKQLCMLMPEVDMSEKKRKLPDPKDIVSPEDRKKLAKVLREAMQDAGPRREGESPIINDTYECP